MKSNDVTRDNYSVDLVDYYLKKALQTSTSIALKSQLFTAIKPVLDSVLHFGTVLDVGCGIGIAAAHLAGHYDRYIGIDPSARICEAARVLHRDNQRVQFLVQDIITTDLPAGIADVILVIGSFHHMESLDPVMEQIVKLARHDAILVVLEPQPSSPLGMLFRTIRGVIDPNYVVDQIYYSEDYLRGIIGRFGFTDITTTYQGFLSPPFAQTILNPQMIFAPLSLLSITVDGLLQSFMPRMLQRYAVNLIITARLNSTHR